MLVEFLTALFSLDFVFFIAFFLNNLVLVFALIILAALLWEGIHSVFLVVGSGLTAMALIDLVNLFGLTLNYFHFFTAFLFVAIVCEADQKPKNFLLALFSLGLFSAFLQPFM